MYECHYRYMRRGFSFEYMVQYWNDPMETMKAADYSYQAFAYVDHGWSTDERLMRFHAIKWRIYTSIGQIPF